MCQACHVIIVLGKHTRSNYVGRDILSWPLGSTHSRITSGVACHHRPWTKHIIGPSRVWHAHKALWQHTWLEEVGHGIPSWTLARTHYHVWLTIITIGQHKQGRTTLGVACYPILEQHTLSHDIERGMISYPIDCTHVRTTFAVAMLSSPLGSTHD